MKMGDFTEKDLIRKGYVKQKDGSWKKDKWMTPLETHRHIKKYGQSANKNWSEPAATHTKPSTNQKNTPTQSCIEIPGIVAGLNGSNGLMRQHWSKRKKQKEYYQMIINDHIKQGKARKHTGPVEVQYIGYKSRFMDWDNYASSFKDVGDSLVKTGIIEEDNPKIVKTFIPKQIKCKRNEQRVVIIIKDHE